MATQQLLRLTDDLSAAMAPLRFSAPVAHVYNPLDYAAAPHRRYIERFGGLGATVLMVGMNPGPWGMAQTGVPFGAVEPARDWLGLGDEPVGKPPEEHPKRPVDGFACRRNEVSGQRLWGWARDAFETPEQFFARFFVANYCPLLFLEEGARNVTPDKLKAAERNALLPPCDLALRQTVEILDVEWVIGIGQWAEKRIHAALDGSGVAKSVRVGRILHPSPASPAANRGWAPEATRQLRDLGIGPWA